jgi:hypothetical protein
MRDLAKSLKRFSLPGLTCAALALLALGQPA